MLECTRINYLYRDAGNYKFRSSFVVSGKFRSSDIEMYLFDGEFFVPSAIGLPILIPEDRNSDDHELHQFEDFEEIQSDGTHLCASELLERIKAASRKGWFDGSFSYFPR